MEKINHVIYNRLKTRQTRYSCSLEIYLLQLHKYAYINQAVRLEKPWLGHQLLTQVIYPSWIGISLDERNSSTS